MKRIGSFVAITVFIFTLSATAKAQILAWDTDGIKGDEASLNSTITDPNLNVSTLTRGAGLLPKGRGDVFNSENFTVLALLTDAIAANEYYQFTVNAKPGFKVSLGTLDVIIFRDGNGPQRFQWQYSLDGFATAGTNIGSEILITDNPGAGTAQPQINLSGFLNLQNVQSTTTVTFRLYGYNAKTNGGDGGFGKINPGLELAIGGYTQVITAVDLADFKATSVAGNIFLEWQTGLEVDNLGFNLYREHKGKRVQVNPSIIAGSAFLVGPSMPLTAGDSYSWFDSKGKNDSVYYLEDVDLKGRRTLHGPIAPVVSSSTNLKPSQRQAMLLSEFNNRSLTTHGPSPYQRGWSASPGELLSNASATNIPEPAAFSAGPGAAKISINQEGWYRVTYADLSAIGFDTNVDPKFLQLFDNGIELPILLKVANPATFSPGDSFEFYGKGLDTPSTDTNVFWLITGNVNGLRITPPPSANSNSNGPNSFLYTIERKERLVYIPSLLNGEKENFFGQVVGDTPAIENLFIENLSPTAKKSALLEVALQGYTSATHQIRVRVNGQEVGTLLFGNQHNKTAQFSVSYTLLHEGSNTVTLETFGGLDDFSLVESVRLTYARSYRASGNFLNFTANGNPKIEGFTNANIKAMDITDPLAVKEVPVSIAASMGGFSATVHAGGQVGRFLAFTPDAVESPEAMELDNPSTLKSNTNSADFVIISYASFSSSLAPLVTLRDSQGLEVMVVDVQDVYDEFSDGEHSPYAIRDFLAWATSNWQQAPSSVMMVGDASLDPRNYLGQGLNDFVPTKLVDTSLLETASDDWLVDFNNDSLPDMAIGRLPVNTLTEAQQLISKIVDYQPSESLQKVLLVIDRNNLGDGFSFLEVGQDAVSTLPAFLPIQILNFADNPDNIVHGLILDGINEGPLVVNYIGHGSVEVWANSVLNSSDAPSLTGDHLPVFMMMTCLNGYYQNPARVSLGEALIRRNDGGAVAVWASSGLTNLFAQGILNRQVYQQLFSPGGMSLGEAAKNAKASVSDMDVRKTWILFGDPTMRLQ